MIREPSSSSSNTNGSRMVWPQVATLKATGWNLLQEPRCADNADVPTLVGAPVWGSTRELLWKLCRSEREKRVNTWWKHHAIFSAWTERGSGSVDFKGKCLELEKKLKNSHWSCAVSQLCSRLLFSEAWASSTKLEKKCPNICIFHGPPLCSKAVTSLGILEWADETRPRLQYSANSLSRKTSAGSNKVQGSKKSQKRGRNGLAAWVHHGSSWCIQNQIPLLKAPVDPNQRSVECAFEGISTDYGSSTQNLWCTIKNQCYSVEVLVPGCSKNPKRL